MTILRRIALGLAGTAALAATVTLHTTAPMTAADKKAPDKAAVERTREQITMLDDLYKTAVVGITQLYVNQQADKPAALAAKAVFDAMKKKGWHNARLVDASGDPKNDENVAKTDFEKKAVKAMKDGKKTLEEIGEVDGKPVLRTATLVPAVLKSCAKCHGVEEGAVLGTIVYELPIK
ncbi:MAG: DUF3365 domain-containing protein [Gemmataceae bacterium]|nr:DUF3365 domain-containing protein [Planctomycetia bacterium]MBX3401288.1 DUF3365 domain-containing protein [Gemmataceae bacterium]